MAAYGEPNFEDVMNALKVTRTYIDKAKEKGIDVNKATELFKLARPALQNNQIKIAMEHAIASQREVVMESLQDTWSKILRAKEDGKDITDSKTIFSQARIIIKSDNFEEAFKLMDEAMKAIKSPEPATEVEKPQSATAAYQMATEKLQETFSKIKEAKDSGVNVDEAEKIFKNAREIIKTKDYEKAIQNCKDVLALLSSPKDLEKIKATESVDKVAKDTKDIVEAGYGAGAEKLLIREIETFVKDAQKALAENNYKQALLLSQKAESSLNQLVTKFISKTLPSLILQAESLIGQARSEGLDVNYEEDLLEQAKQANSQNRYIESRNLSRKAEESVKSAKHKQKVLQISEDLTPLKKMLLDAGAANINIKKLETSVKKVESALENKNYSEAQESLNAAKYLGESIKESLKVHSLKSVLDVLEKDIKEIDRQHPDTAKPLRAKFDSIKGDAGKKEPSEVLLLVGELEKDVRQAKLKDDLERTHRTWSQIESRSASPLPEDTRRSILDTLEGLKRAERAGDLERAIADTPPLIAKLEAEVAEYGKQLAGIKSEAAVHFERTEKQVDAMVLADIDNKPLMASMDVARECYDRNDFDACTKMLAVVGTQVETGAMERLQALRESIAVCKMNGMDTAGVEAEFFSMQPLLAGKDFPAVFRCMQAVQGQLNTLNVDIEKAKEEVTALVLSAQESIERARGSGADTAHLETKLQEAMEAMNSRQFSKARTCASEISIGLKAVLDEIEMRSALAALKEIKIKLVEAQKNGQDIKEAETVFRKAEPHVRSRDFMAILGIIAKVKELIEVSPEQRAVSEIRATLDVLKMQLAEFKAQKRDIMDPEMHILQAEESLRNKELLWAKEYACKAREELEAMARAPAPSKEPPPAEPEPEPAQAPPQRSQPEPKAPEPAPMPEPAPVPTPKQAPPAPERPMSMEEVIKALSKVRQDILKTKNAGKDIKEAEALFRKAEPLLRKMDTNGCQELIRDITRALDQANNQRALNKDEQERAATCKEAIESIESVIDDFMHTGVNITQLKDWLDRSKGSLAKNDFESSLEYATLGISEVERIQERLPLMEGMGELERTIADAKGMGADVGRPQSLVLEAKVALDAGNMEKAKELIARATDLAESARNIAKVLVSMPGQKRLG